MANRDKVLGSFSSKFKTHRSRKLNDTRKKVNGKNRDEQHRRARESKEAIWEE